MTLRWTDVRNTPSVELIKAGSVFLKTSKVFGSEFFKLIQDDEKIIEGAKAKKNTTVINFNIFY